MCSLQINRLLIDNRNAIANGVKCGPLTTAFASCSSRNLSWATVDQLQPVVWLANQKMRFTRVVVSRSAATAERDKANLCSKRAPAEASIDAASSVGTAASNWASVASRNEPSCDTNSAPSAETASNASPSTLRQFFFNQTRHCFTQSFDKIMKTKVPQPFSILLKTLGATCVFTKCMDYADAHESQSTLPSSCKTKLSDWFG